MADNTPQNGTAEIATDEIAGAHFQRVKLDLGADGVSSPVVGAFPVSGTFWQATQPVSLASVPTHEVTGTFWQATQPVSGTVAVSNMVAQGLTDAQLRATPVPISSAASYAEDTPHVSGAIGNLMLAIRSDGDATTADNGDYTVLKLDEEGRLKVSSKPASYTPTTGNITANGQTIFVNVERFSNLMIHCAGTFSTVNVTFEGSLNSTNGTDGNWFLVQAIRSSANTIETATGNLSAAPTYAWELSVNALKYFRVRATAWTSGTQVWTMIPGTYATEPIPGAQVSGTQPVSGTITATPANPTNASIVNSAATTNGTVIKGSAGNLYGVVASNNGAGSAYVKFHNSTTVTAGTTAVALWILVGAGQTVRFDWGPLGARFSTGICMSITGAVADNDTTAVAAGQVKVVTSFI